MASKSSQSGAARLIPQGSHAGANAIDINRPAFVIGTRKDAVRLHLESSTVSKVHCVIVAHDWGCSIHDLGSRTRTVVNGSPIIDADLNDGDIINIGRFEFKYAAPAEGGKSPQSAPAAELDVSTLTDSFPITKRVIQIGRRRGSDIEIEDKAISNTHAIIYERNGKRYLRDMTSRTGTWLNGKLIHQEELPVGGKIRIGPVEIGYRLAESSSTVGLAPFGLDDEPLKLDEDDLLPPSIDAKIGKPVKDDLDLIAVEPDHAAHETLIPVEDSTPATADIDLPLEIEPEIAPEPETIAPPVEESKSVADESEEDALLALRRGWKGASSLTDDDIAPVEPVAEIPEPAPVAKSPVEEIIPEVASEPVIETIDESPEAVDIESLVPVEPELPVAETPVEPEIETTAQESETAELDLESLLPAEPAAETPEEFEKDFVIDSGKTPVAEAPAELVEDAVIPVVEEAPEAVDLESLLPTEPATEPEVIVDETPVEELDLESLLPAESEHTAVAPEPEAIAEPAEIVDESPVESLDLESLLPTESEEPVAESQPLIESENESAPIVEETISEPVIEELVSPVVDESPEDDGAIDLDEIAPSPVAESISEPDLVLEADDAGITPVNPVIEELAEPEIAAIDDKIDEDDFFNEIIQPSIAAETPEVESERSEPLVIDHPGILAEPAIPEVAQDKPIGELPEVPLIVHESPVIAEPAQPTLDLSMPLSPIAEAPHAAPPPTLHTDVSTDVDDLLAPHDVTLEPVTEVVEQQPEVDAATVDQVKIDDAEEIAVDNDDTAFAVGLDNLDPFDLDDEDPFDDSPTAVHPAQPIVESPVAKTDSVSDYIEIIEPTVATPESAMPTELDTTPSSDADLDDLLKDLGIDEDGEIDLDELTATTESGDLVEEHLSKLDQEAQKTQQEIDDLLKPRKEDKPPATLSDLIPKDPPLMGGAFMGLGGMALGGSPMVDLNAPIAPRAESPKPRSKPPVALPENDTNKPHRVGFTGPGADAPQQASPFSASPKTISDVLVGRRATQSVDTFASPSPSLDVPKIESDGLDAISDVTPPADPSEDEIEKSLVARAKTPEELAILKTADRYRPRGVIRAVTDAPQPPVQPPVPPVNPEAVAADRKKRLRIVFLCTLLTLPLAGLAAWIAWKALPSTTRIDATITFKRLNMLSDKEAATFRNIQDNILASDSTQSAAVAQLDPAVKDDFLRDSNLIMKTVEREPRIRWPEKPGDTMHLVMTSRNKAEDVARMRALASAMIKANADRIIAYRELDRKISEQDAEVQQLQAKINSITEDIRKYQAMGDQRPDDQAINDKITEQRKLENQRKDVLARRLDAEAAIESIKHTPFVDLASLEADKFFNADDEYKKLTADLDDLTKQFAADSADSEKKLKESRAALNDLVKKFEPSLNAAQQGNAAAPQAAKFFESAKVLFKQTRDLTEQLLQRQEDQKKRLSDIKIELSKQIEEHTHDLLEKDETLKKHTDALEMYKRQLNAANAEGLKEDAVKLAAQVQLYQSLVDGRIDQIKNAPFYAKTIDSLTKLIADSEKAIQDDRKHVDEALSLAQDQFNKTAPDLATLSDKDRELAATFQQQLVTFNEARKSYSKSADEIETANAVRETQFKQNSDLIKEKIADRKAKLMTLARDDQADRAEKARKAKIDEKTKELAEITNKENQIEKSLETINTQLASMNDIRHKLIENDQLRDDQLAEKGRLESVIRTRTADLNSKRNSLAGRIVPEDSFELQTYDDNEQRPWLRPAAIGGSAGAVFMVMLIPIVWNLMLASRDSSKLARTKPVTPANVEAIETPGTNGHAKVEEEADVLNP